MDAVVGGGGGGVGRGGDRDEGCERLDGRRAGLGLGFFWRCTYLGWSDMAWDGVGWYGKGRDGCDGADGADDAMVKSRAWLDYTFTWLDI